MSTLAEVLNVQTEDVILNEILDEASARNLDVRGLPDRSFPRGVFAIEAKSHAKYQALRKKLVENRLLDLATDAEGVALVMRGFYQLERAPATYALHEVQITDVAGVGPRTIKANERTFLSTSGAEFRLIEDVVVPLNGTSAKVRAKAEVSGSAGNVQVGSITRWRAPIAGLAVSNPAIGSSGSSLVASARDAESIPSMVARCRDRWGTEGRAGNDAAYRTWVHEAFTSAGQVSPITRMRVRGDNPYGPGTIGIVLANAGGPAIPAEVSQIDGYLQPRKALGSGALTTVAASSEAVPLSLVLYATGNTSAAAQVEAALNAYESKLDIGGRIFVAEIIERVMGVAGMYNVRVNAPLADHQASMLNLIDLTPRTVSLG